MYSIILMASLSTAPAAPAFDTLGVLFARPRAGCAGSTAAPPRERFVASAPVRGFAVRVGERVKDRPRFFVAREHAPRASYGCAGSFAAPPPVRATGCTGAVLMPPAAAPVEVGRPHLFQRAMVHRQLRVALGRAYDSGTPAQKAAAKRALEDPAVYDAAVAKVTNELNRAAKEQGAGAVGAIGEGKILDAILSRLPQILQAIEAIIKLIDGLSLAAPGWQRMPVGPHPLPRLVVPQTAWSSC